MNHNNSAPYGQNYHDKEYPTPTPPPARQSVSNTVTLGLSIVAVVMFMSLFFKGYNVAITVISTALVYGGIITLVVLIDSGYFNKRVEEHAKIEIARMQYVRVVEPQQLTAYSPPVDPPLSLPQPSSFVAPVADPDDSAKREAASWLAQLYGADGEPDPKKVLMQSDKERPGRLRVAAPSRPVKEYLLACGVLLNLGNGFRLNLVRYPTRDHALAYLRANGVSRSRTHPLPPTPTYSGAEVQP